MFGHEDDVRFQTIYLLKIATKNVVLIFDDEIETGVSHLHQTFSLYCWFKYKYIWEFKVGGELF